MAMGYKGMKKKDLIYFLSVWMANFGVEPLLLFLFLRFLPAFFCFLILRNSVCLVHETMVFLLLTYCIIIKRYKTRGQLIQWPSEKVKKFITLAILLSTLPMHPTQAQEKGDPQAKEVIISVGEQYEIKDLSVTQLSNGNPQVLGHLFRSKTKSLLLKGKKMGYSHLVLWTGKQTKQEIHVYVVSKRAQLKLGQMANFLKEMKIQSRFSGDRLIIESEITSKGQFVTLKNLQKQNPSVLHFEGTLNPSLEKELLIELYEIFWNHHLDSVRCWLFEIELTCELFDYDQLPAKIGDELAKKYGLNIQVVPSPRAVNYRIKLKVIQIESGNEQVIKSGLEQFSGSISNFFQFSLEEIIGNNNWVLKQGSLSYKLLAEPEIILGPGSKAQIKVGTELSFQNQNDARGINQTDWKETGLNINLELQKKGAHFLLNYQHLLSRGNNTDAISFGTGKSTLLVELNHPVKLFEVTLESDQDNKMGLPWFSRIPILGNLFKSKENRQTYQKITCLLLLEKV